MSPERVVAPMSVKRGNSKPDRARSGALADDDVDLEVLHGRIEDLLDRPVEPVDLVDEQHVAVFEVREDGGHVCLALQRRPRRGDDVHTHLEGDDVGKSRLAQSRRACQKHVVERLVARFRGSYEDIQLLAKHRLAHERHQRTRPQRTLHLLVLLDHHWVCKPIGQSTPTFGKAPYAPCLPLIAPVPSPQAERRLPEA